MIIRTNGGEVEPNSISAMTVELIQVSYYAKGRKVVHHWYITANIRCPEYWRALTINRSWGWYKSTSIITRRRRTYSRKPSTREASDLLQNIDWVAWVDGKSFWEECFFWGPQGRQTGWYCQRKSYPNQPMLPCQDCCPVGSPCARRTTKPQICKLDVPRQEGFIREESPIATI